MDTDEFTLKRGEKLARVGMAQVFWRTYETGGVIVTHGLGVTEGLEDGIGLDDLIFKGALCLVGFRWLLGGSTDGGEVGNNLLGVLGLSGTRFTSDQHRLVLVISQHVDVGTIRDGEKMGWNLSATLATIHFGDAVGIQRPTLVGIDDNTEEARVGLEEMRKQTVSDLLGGTLVEPGNISTQNATRSGQSIFYALRPIDMGKINSLHDIEK
jgi:hypothetical protein